MRIPASVDLLAVVIAACLSLVSCAKEPAVAPLPDLETPSDVRVTAVADTVIVVRWTDNSDVESGYAVERNENAMGFVEIARTPANVTMYSDTGRFRSDSMYVYRVRTFTGVRYSSYSDSASIVVHYNLAAPTELVCTVLSSTSVKLVWTDNTFVERGFAIDRAVDNGPYEQIGTVGANQTEYIDLGFTSGPLYAYRVRTFSAANWSEPSLPVEISGVPENLFPLVVGQRLSYSGYLTASSTGTKIESSEPGYTARLTIGPVTSINSVYPNPPVNVSGTGIIVADSTDVPGGGIGTITMTHFFDRDPSTARIRMLMNLGYFYRIFAINRSDSLQYILLMDPRQGLRNSYTCFTESYVGTIAGSSAIIGMTYTGQWVGTETIQTAVGSFSTWLLEVRQTVTIGSTPVAAFIVMRIWFAQGIGPVKMELSGNAEQYGHVRVLASKNF